MPGKRSKPRNKGQIKILSASPRSLEQARIHAQTRRAHTSELMEDYVEIIADLIDQTGEARVVDIAKCLGVTHVTVSKTVARLQRAKLVDAKPYRAIFLTDTGRELAMCSKKRHDAVVKFLLAIGVSEKTALRDAEGLEHHVSDETLAAFEKIAQAIHSN